MILYFQITPERPQITPNHTRSSQNHAFGINFLYWASPNSFSSLSPSQIWDKFDTKYEYSKSIPSTRIRNFTFQMVDSKSKSHYSIPTLMQNPTEFTSRVFKKQCFWRKKMAYTHVWTLNFVFLSPPPTLSCAPFVCIVPVFSEDLVEHNFQSFA